MNIWKNDNEFGIYNLTQENGKIICRLRPKYTLKYVDFVGQKVFVDENTYMEWFYTTNYYYGNISPYEMTLDEVFNMLMCIEYSIYI